MFGSRRRYFDSGAYTPLSKRLLPSLIRLLRELTTLKYANAQSFHEEGRTTREVTGAATATVAGAYGVKAGHVLFASGASEANYLAIRTAVLLAHERGVPFSKMELVTTDTEHPSIDNSFSFMEKLGAKVHYIPTLDDGSVTPETVAGYINEGTVIFCFQYVQGVTGRKLDAAGIARAIHAKNPHTKVHADCAQAAYYFNCAPEAIQADMVTIDAGKLFSMQGVGALIFKSGDDVLGLSGKRDLRDIRIGTPSTFLIHSLAESVREAENHREADAEHVQQVRDEFLRLLAENPATASVRVYGKELQALKKLTTKVATPHILYLQFPEVNHPYLATLMDEVGFAVATGTACRGPVGKGLRVTFMPTTTLRDVRALVPALAKQLPLARA